MFLAFIHKEGIQKIKQKQSGTRGKYKEAEKEI